MRNRLVAMKNPTHQMSVLDNINESAKLMFDIEM